MTKPTLDAWQKLAQREIGTKPLQDLHWPSPEGISIAPLYTATENAELPGLPPFRRGPYASMYVNKPWTIRQYAGFATASESNAFYRAGLAAGQTGLSVAFDLATHRGYDSDHPRVVGDVGKAGVAIDSVEDMKILFADIPLSRMSVSMTMNGAVLPVLAAYIVAAEEQGATQAQLSGTIQNDILKEFMVRNTYIYPPAPSLRIVADIIAYTAQHMPKFNSISISGYHMHEAGATAVQELAFTLADGLEYIRQAQNIGLDIEQFAPRLSFFFGIGMNFFMEIAKLRAARVLWSRLLQKKFNASPRAQMLRTHCQTSGVSLTEQDPYNNIIRTTLEALAAVLGGTQSLHTNSFDEAVALPSEFAARLARNTQLIIAEESQVTRTVDPLGGSHYIENLTDELINAATALIEKIEAEGGMAKTVAQGWPKLAIEEAAARKQARLERSEDVQVGVNKYRLADETPIAARQIDNSAVRAEQVARLEQIKATRNDKAVQAALAALTHAARTSGDNLLALSITAMRARATVGEVSDALEAAFGRYEAPILLNSGIYAQEKADDAEFSALRAEIARFTQDYGQAPHIFIGKLGQDGHDRGAKIIAGAFADAGFTVTLGPLFQTPQEAATQAINGQAHVIGISTQAAAHLTLVPELMQALAAQNRRDIAVIVGGVIPMQDYAALNTLGVAGIYGPGTHIPAAAQEILAHLRQRLPQKGRN